MADETRIVLDNDEYCGLLVQFNTLLFGLSKLQEQAVGLAGMGLEHKTPRGNLFYLGEARESIEQYYTMLAFNVDVLNQFYSKLGDYMVYVQKELNIADEYIKKYIEGYLAEGQTK